MSNARALLGCFVALCSVSSLTGARTIPKRDGSCFFAADINAIALDQFDGTLYAATSQDGSFSLAKAARCSCQICPLAQNNPLTNKAINGLSLVARNCQATSDIALFFEPFEAESNQVAVQHQQNGSVALSGQLYDAIGNSGSHVSAITSNKTCVFARIISSEVTPPQGDSTNSGIATIHIDNPFNLSIRQGSILTNSVLLDTTSNEAKVGADLASLEVLDMHWSECLQTLYIGLNVTIDASSGAGSTGYSIVKGTIDANCNLSLSAITTAQPAPGSLHTRFSYQNDGSELDDVSAIAHHIRTMKTSTEENYLIINGGIQNTSNLQGNSVYALPLAPQESVDAGCITLADGFDHLRGCAFEVGGGPAPWDPSITVSDMVVIDDTVYVSVVVPTGRDNSNDPGVWSSQAMFDAHGAIISWTAWERAFPSEGGGEFSRADNTPHFAVDAKTAQLWRVREDGAYAAPENRILRSQWSVCKRDSVGLAKAASQAMKDGIFTFLDLPKGSAGLASIDHPHLSLVLFGGFEKVLFARTKFGLDNHVTATHEFITDLEQFENQNIKLTDKRDGLAGVGCIRSLGYSYNNEDLSKGFFFAGTDRGLYAYARSEETGQAGEGFNGSLGLSELDDFPFENLSFPAQPERGSFPGNVWHRVAQDVITKCMTVENIRSDGSHIFFTTFEPEHNLSCGSSDCLFSLEITERTVDMAPRKIAQSGIAGIPCGAIFTGFTILTTSSDPYNSCDTDAFFGLISTNDGIYTSTADLRSLVMPPVGEEWVPIEHTTGLSYNFLNSVSKDITNSRKALGIYFADEGVHCSFDRSRFVQVGNNNGSQAMAGIAGRDFYTNRSSLIDTLDYSVSLWSDGARRLFTQFSTLKPCIYTALASLPFDAARWHMSQPCIIKELCEINRVNIIGNISANGQVIVGTDNGLIALE